MYELNNFKDSATYVMCTSREDPVLAITLVTT